MSLTVPMCPTVPNRARGMVQLTVPPCPRPYRGARYGHPRRHNNESREVGHGLTTVERTNTMLKTCAECGQPSASTWCEQHTPKRPSYPSSAPQVTATERGYDTEWRKLSERARRLQPWCSDCGSRDDLTADHLPSAWARKAENRPLRLSDVEVVCRACNVRRGSSRAGSRRSQGGGGAERAPRLCAPVAKFPSQSLTRRVGGTSWR